FGIPIVWIILSMGLFASSYSTKIPLLPLFVAGLVASGDITMGEVSLEIMAISGVWVVFELVQKDARRQLLALCFSALWLMPNHMWGSIVIALLFLPRMKLVAEDIIFVLCGCL